MKIDQAQGSVLGREKHCNTNSKSEFECSIPITLYSRLKTRLKILLAFAFLPKILKKKSHYLKYT